MNKEEAINRNLLRFVHAQDSGGIYDGIGLYFCSSHQSATYSFLSS